MRGCSCRGTVGFAHVVPGGGGEDLGRGGGGEHLGRERSRGGGGGTPAASAEGTGHGVVKCALGWACWKTYLRRPEADQTRGSAMTLLAIGLG